MIWLARLKPWAAAAFILATAVVAVQGRQQPEGAREQAKTSPPPTGVDIAANQALARKQLALIDEALASVHRLAQQGRLDISSPSSSIWGRRKLETLRKTGAGKAEILAALEKYIDSLKEEEAIAEARHQAALGTMVSVYDVQFRRMEAEIWLNEEKAR